MRQVSSVPFTLLHSLSLPLVSLLFASILLFSSPTSTSAAPASPGRLSPRRSLAGRSEETWVKRRLEELERKEQVWVSSCEWCSGLPDGMYCDELATPPCSRYFHCSGANLAALHYCAPSQKFLAPAGRCVSAATNRTEGRILLDAASSVSISAPITAELNALLEFKSRLWDLSDLLSNWVVARSLSPPSYSSSSSPPSHLSSSSASPPVAHSPSPLPPPCNGWYGVVCDHSTFRVVSITIGEIDKSIYTRTQFLGVGAIPANFSALTHLKNLTITSTRNFGLPQGLGGPLPAELSRLPLTLLDLSLNAFSGSIPQEFSRLTNLTSLVLASNFLGGGLGTWISSLQKLTFLDLGDNNFTGKLPDSVFELPQLQSLTLNTAGFSGSPIPLAVSNLRALTSLSANRLNLMGTIPDMGNLKNLGNLDLSNNMLSGSLPASLSRLTSMSNFGSINLGSNALSGSLPSSLFSSLCLTGSSFNQLILDNNSFSGSLPASLSACTALQTVGLSQNQLSGRLPSFFSTFNQLDGLRLQDNRFIGSLPASIINGPVKLNVSNNLLSGPISPSVIACSSIYAGSSISFSAASNKFTGVFPSFSSACFPYIGVLDIHNNSLTGSLPAALFARATQLATLDLSANRLSGSVTHSGICAVNTQDVPPSFNISRNMFSGNIPPSLMRCNNYMAVDLSNNAFSGSIPVSISSLGSPLAALDLSSNRFTGVLPSTLAKLSGLTFFSADNNSLTGRIPDAVTSLRRLATFSASANQLSGNIPLFVGNLSSLKVLNLRNNLFSGPVPVDMQNLRLLTFLDVSSNQLNGTIPQIQNLSLSFLNVSNNLLSGAIPEGSLTNFTASSFLHNPSLCSSISSQGYPKCPTPSRLSDGAIAGIAIGAFVLILAIVLLAWFALRVRNSISGGTMLVFEKLDFKLTIEEILRATENFDDKYMLGRGGFGSVYRATLQDGRTVAIKQLATESQQGEKEFLAEMDTLGNLRHRNLVTLVAAYIAKPPSADRLLIYAFLSGGSLDRVLVKDMPKDSPYRKWQCRKNIALDVARGMKYLHHDSNPRIIHRDMKPANILLDENQLAHVADFGLAREADITKDHQSTAVFGTIGYLAPEYSQRGHMSFKSDVFAYGVLLLQLLTGKQPTDEDVAERGLARWVGSQAATSILDNRLEHEGFLDEIRGAIKLGTMCTARVAADRPSMEEIVYFLEHLEGFGNDKDKGK